MGTEQRALGRAGPDNVFGVCACAQVCAPAYRAVTTIPTPPQHCGNVGPYSWAQDMSRNELSSNVTFKNIQNLEI